MQKCRFVSATFCLATCFMILNAPMMRATPQSADREGTQLQRRSDEQPEMEFVAGPGAGEMETSFGVRLGFTDYRASDGTYLTVFYLVKDDTEVASRAFNNEIAKAVKVLKRDKRIDETGEIVGERAEILVSGGKPDSPYHAILWRDRGSYHRILSRSPRHNLLLEKIYKH